MQSFLLLTLILLSVSAYYLGRKRALAVAGGQIRNLHSLPSFYWFLHRALVRATGADRIRGLDYPPTEFSH